MDDFLEAVERSYAQIALVDTPGQMETFVFRPAGPAIIKKALERAGMVVVYVVDLSMGASATDLATALSMATAAKLRLSALLVLALNKIDLVENPEEVRRLVVDRDYFAEKLEEDEGFLADVVQRFAEVVEEGFSASRPILVSAKTMEGILDLYDIIHESFCVCGDLT